MTAQILPRLVRLPKPLKGVLTALGCLFACWLFLASLVALGFGGNPFDNNPFDNSAFNQSQWRADAGRSDGGSGRGPMAQDIVRHHLRSGMPAQEVVHLLGEPQRYSAAGFANYYRHSKTYFQTGQTAPVSASDTVFRYPLGEELDMAWGIDHADLYLYFSNGKYTGSRIGWPG